MLNVSVIGVGNSARVFHVTFIKSLPDRFKLYSVLERKATAENSVAKSIWGNDIKVVNDYQSILNDANVDVIVITTANDSHYSLAKDALINNKHVIIEKPMTPNSTQAFKLAKLAKDKDLILAVFHNRRLDSDYLTAKELIKSGKLGQLSTFESRFDRFRPNTKNGWREQNIEGSGVTYDLGSHLIDQALELFGKPKYVSSIIQNSRQAGNLEVDDSFLIHLHYPKTDNQSIPLIVTVGAATLSCVEHQLRFCIKGTNGSYIKYGFDTQEDQLKSGVNPTSDEFGKDDEESYGIFTDSDLKVNKVPTLKGQWIEFYKNVSDAINKKSELNVDPFSAAFTIKLIELSLQSSKEGRKIQVY